MLQTSSIRNAKDVWNYIKLPDEVSAFERDHLARMDVIIMRFFAAHIPVFMLVGYLAGTGAGTAFALTAAVLAGPLIARRAFSHPRAMSLVYGFTAMAMGGVLVHLGQGPMQIEMHFYFFVLLALLSIFANPMVIVVAAVAVALHHLTFYFFLPRSMFNYDAGLEIVLVHALFVVLESVAAIYLARGYFDNVIGLERIVKQRTSQLDQRNQEMRLVLDNVNQGFLTVALDGSTSDEYSTIVETWFGKPESGQPFSELVARVDETAAEWFDLGLESIIDDFLPLEMSLDQLPKRIQVDEATMRVDYSPIFGEDGGLEKLLVVISDITARLERERMEAEQREIITVFSKISEDRIGFLEFFNEANGIMESVAKDDLPVHVLKRSIHTVKGNSSLFGLEAIAALCHTLESDIDETGDRPSAAELTELQQRWSTLRENMQSFAGETDAIQIDDTEYQLLLERVLAGAPPEELAERIRAWKLEPAAQRLDRLADQVKNLSSRLGKGEVEVEVDADTSRLEPERWAPFWSAFVHAMRNAVDHGLESADERADLGKPERGKIALSASKADGEFRVAISDDGRGIDWDKLAAKAHAKGLPTETRQHLVEALFADGLSTRDAVSTTSGRGVGMAALRSEAKGLGGEIDVDSEVGKGTTFTFRFPAKAMG